MKGSVVLSENLLAIVGILISFVLIVLVVQLVFSQQTTAMYESIYQSVARDISTAIDRAVASAGSIAIQQDMPKGLKLNLLIDYKTIIVQYDTYSVTNYFSGLIHSGPYKFLDPKTLCIVKTNNDNRVTITDKICSCKTNDDICDPECVVENKCDSKCASDNKTGVCNPFCANKYSTQCDKNCYANEKTGICQVACIKENEEDGICSPDCNNVKKGVCDLDCYNKYSNGITGVCDPDCPSMMKGKILEQNSVKYKTADGVCYTGCVNKTGISKSKTTLPKDGICDLDCDKTKNICDPDCPNSPACSDICIEEGKKSEGDPCCEGLVKCPSDNICKKRTTLTCCGNGICEWRPGTTNGWESGNKIQWETFYTCPQDCSDDPHTKTSCAGGLGFNKGVCYNDILDASGQWIGDEPVWVSNLIQVCNPEAESFLDRRNWDIKEVIKSISSPVPEGWAWDGSRYRDACNRMVNAQTNTGVNEKYSSDIAMCCSEGGFCDGRATYDPTIAADCNGVGFCADHAIGLLSILRTLGVPADHVYIVFSGGPGTPRHAWVAMKCNSTLPVNLQPDECQGNDGKWLSLDATGHFVKLLDDSSYNILCIFWNDQGLYAQNKGKIDATKGYAYPQDVKCSTTDMSNCAGRHSDCGYDKLCKKPFNVECVVP